MDAATVETKVGQHTVTGCYAGTCSRCDHTVMRMSADDDGHADQCGRL